MHQELSHLSTVETRGPGIRPRRMLNFFTSSVSVDCGISRYSCLGSGFFCYFSYRVSIDLSVCLSVYLSIYPSIYLSTYLSIHLFIYLCIIYASIHAPIYSFIYLFIRLSIYLSKHLSLTSLLSLAI